MIRKSKIEQQKQTLISSVIQKGTLMEARGKEDKKTKSILDSIFYQETLKGGRKKVRMYCT